LKQISDFFLPNSLSQVELPGLSREEIWESSPCYSPFPFPPQLPIPQTNQQTISPIYLKFPFPISTTKHAGN
jgi:hypothetical protein